MRFFHKFSSINYNFLGLVNGILLKAKRKERYTKAIKYLSKYEYALDFDTKLSVNNDYKNKIWQCWFQGKEKIPPLVKKCIESVSKYHGDSVIFLDSDNILDYVELPDYIIEKHKKGIIPYANFSDMCRLSLLAKYGGAWVDSTIYLTEKIPDEILNADFFTFRSLQTDLLKNINNLNDFELYCNNFSTVISFESPYFIAAKAGNKLVNGIRNMFLEYWKYENNLVDYLMIDKFFILALIHNSEFKEQFLNMPKYYLENVLLMQHALFEPFDENLFKAISSKTAVHKLTHKNLHRNPYANSFLNIILEK